MKNVFIAILLFLFFQLPAMNIVKMTCEMAESPLLVTALQPRFGWQLESPEQGASQSAWRLCLFADNNGKKIPVWDSGKMISGQSQLVPYAGKKLLPGTRYFWRVKVWDENRKPSGWSNWAEFTTAPDPTSLDAQWIGAINHRDARIPVGKIFPTSEFPTEEYKNTWNNIDSLSRKSILLRKSFKTEKEIRRAVAYVCGLGHYDLTLNGQKAGDSEFAPLWSDYQKTVYYNACDVTSILKKGENAVGVLLGNGFYNEQGGRYVKLKVSYGAPTLFFKLKIDYRDGTTEEIKSGADWKYSLSPVTFNSLYGGEDYDARLEHKGWDQSGFDDGDWKPVVVQDAPAGKLTAQTALPVKIMEHYGVKSFKKLSRAEIDSASRKSKRKIGSSTLVFDMGQNLAGFPEITVCGKRGDQITLVVAESLTEEGAANQRQTGRQHLYQYTLKGDGDETWHPRFSYYGFRYIQVEGVVNPDMENPQELPVLKRIRSCFVYNSVPQVASFECSDTIFNKAHGLIANAVKSNMQAVFTDCPHREKLGWLEQIHLNGPGLMYNYDLANFSPKIMRDIADAQYPDGAIHTTAPEYTLFQGPGMDDFAESPEWSSTFMVLPWLQYQYYGDDSLIRQYYPRMKKYVDYLAAKAKGHILSHGLGDWYDYGDFRAGFSKNTPVPLVATAYYYYDLKNLSRAAEMLGNEADKAIYSSLAEEVRLAFNKHFFNRGTWQYGSGSQTSNAMPLYFDMVDPEYREAVLANLVADIKAHNNRLTTGDVGTRYLFMTLAENGLNELMFKMNSHEDAPGYGFQLKFGATTLTEQWDPRQGASWNHFMMGHIDEWFFSSLAGIRAGAPGFKEIIIQPQSVGNLRFVNASFESLYGRIAVSWKKEAGRFFLSVEIPVNCTAKIFLPGESEARVTGSGKFDFEL